MPELSIGPVLPANSLLFDQCFFGNADELLSRLFSSSNKPNKVRAR
jgi:hypothetical protein